jgi:hypothetical protein
MKCIKSLTLSFAVLCSITASSWAAPTMTAPPGVLVGEDTVFLSKDLDNPRVVGGDQLVYWTVADKESGCPGNSRIHLFEYRAPEGAWNSITPLAWGPWVWVEDPVTQLGIGVFEIQVTFANCLEETNTAGPYYLCTGDKLPEIILEPVWFDGDGQIEDLSIDPLDPSPVKDEMFSMGLQYSDERCGCDDIPTATWEYRPYNMANPDEPTGDWTVVDGNIWANWQVAFAHLDPPIGMGPFEFRMSVTDCALQTIYSDIYYIAPTKPKLIGFGIGDSISTGLFPVVFDDTEDRVDYVQDETYIGGYGGKTSLDWNRTTCDQLTDNQGELNGSFIGIGCIPLDADFVIIELGFNDITLMINYSDDNDTDGLLAYWRDQFIPAIKDRAPDAQLLVTFVYPACTNCPVWGMDAWGPLDYVGIEDVPCETKDWSCLFGNHNQNFEQWKNKLIDAIDDMEGVTHVDLFQEVMDWVGDQSGSDPRVGATFDYWFGDGRPDTGNQGILGDGIHIIEESQNQWFYETFLKDDLDAFLAGLLANQ